MAISMGFNQYSYWSFKAESPYDVTRETALQNAEFGLWIVGFGILVILIGAIVVAIGILAVFRVDRAIQIARKHEKITVEEIAKASGVQSDKVRQILSESIARKTLYGVVEEDTFIRGEEPEPEDIGVERIIEREVILTRRIPPICHKCGADVNPEEVDWVGPDTVRCPHCGASLVVTAERL
jgi:predicted Zn-ribbon and HTH transcriptional regulator